MKLVHCIAFLVILSAVSLAQSKNFNRTVDFVAGGDLRVNTDVGTVKITSWERNQVEVIARIEGRSHESVSADYMRRAVEATEIEILGSGNRVSIKANYDNVPYESSWGGRNRVIPRIEWEIRAPRRANIDLDTDRSEAEVRGFEGRHLLKTDRSPLRVEDMTGELRLEIDRGNTSRFSNVRGSLQVEADRTHLTFDRLQLTGDSRIEIDRGDIEMRMAGSQGFQLSMNKERRATLQSDFPITTNNFNDDRIEGSINGGGPRLAIRADRGKVHLRNN
ncbi:MAG TPA: hypothetical protein VFZ34_10325 [Blastocatellia bacterium]|nr:hypothetical protein [Blastocatellia bacterium]